MLLHVDLCLRQLLFQLLHAHLKIALLLLRHHLLHRLLALISLLLFIESLESPPLLMLLLHGLLQFLTVILQLPILLFLVFQFAFNFLDFIVETFDFLAGLVLHRFRNGQILALAYQLA